MTSRDNDGGATVPDMNSLLEDLKASPPATEEDLRALLEQHSYAITPMGEEAVEMSEEPAPEAGPLAEMSEDEPAADVEEPGFSGPFDPKRRMSAVRKNMGAM